MKKIFFALLSASLVFFAACQQEPNVKVSDDAEVLEYKPSTYDITVESAGSWTLEGEYDWITPSKTSGNSGDVISFTTILNTSGLIRTANYSVVSNGEETSIILYQKSGTLDAVLDLSLLNKTDDGRAELELNLSTKNSDDYKEYGYLIGLSDKVGEATSVTVGTDMAAGIKSINIEDLDPEKDYYVWAYVTSLVDDEVLSNTVGLFPPVCINAADAATADFQTLLDDTKQYSEIRFEKGIEFKGTFEARPNLRITGGWDSEFKTQSNDKEDYLVLDAEHQGTVLFIPRTVSGFVLDRVKIANGNARNGGGLKIDGKAIVQYCWFDNNYGAHRGGAIGSDPDGGVDPGMSVYTVANSIFTRNGGVEHGSCICVDYNCNGTFVNNLFAENHGVTLDDWWHILMTYAGGVFVNNTIVANVMTNGSIGKAIFGARHDYPTRAAYPLVFMNNLIVGNTAAESADGTLGPNEHPVPAMRHKTPIDINNLYTRSEDSVKNNLMEGYASDSVENGFNAGNTYYAPKEFSYTYADFFKDYANGDYTLVQGTAVNAGATHPTVDAVLAKYNKDLAGNPRIAGGKVDLGCYELQ